jgi:negative regulator of genetic competence, sporulation and motility
MGDTSVRMDNKDYRSGFEYVERVCKSTSKVNIINYEVELIKKFKIIEPSKVVHVSTSKASRLTTYNGFYYIYVVFNI